MTYIGNKQTLSWAQADDLQAVIDGAMDRFIELSKTLPNLTPGDRAVTALGNLIERITVTALLRLDQLGEVELVKAYEAATIAAVHSAVAHIGNLPAPARAPFAIAAAHALSSGLNRKEQPPCDCDSCRRKRSTDRRAH